MVRQTVSVLRKLSNDSFSILLEVGWKLLVRARFGKERLEGLTRFSVFARLTFASPLPYSVERQLNY